MAAIVGSNQYGLDCELFTGKETAQRGETMVRSYTTHQLTRAWG